MDENPSDDGVRQTLAETAVRHVCQLRRRVNNSFIEIILDVKKLLSQMLTSRFFGGKGDVWPG